MASAKARKMQELREARGISAGELSRRLDVDEATIRRWEAGDEEVGEGVLPRLAESLGISQDALRHLGDEEHHGRA
jgi:transcriptional regulator with XRE-family HTH domain